MQEPDFSSPHLSANINETKREIHGIYCVLIVKKKILSIDNVIDPGSHWLCSRFNQTWIPQPVLKEFTHSWLSTGKFIVYEKLFISGIINTSKWLFCAICTSLQPLIKIINHVSPLFIFLVACLQSLEWHKVRLKTALNCWNGVLCNPCWLLAEAVLTRSSSSLS